MSLFDVPPPWTEDAACLGFRSGLPAYYWDDTVAGESAAERTLRVQVAVAVCGVCPVQDQCLAEALAGRGGGVRAGQLFADRAGDLYSNSPGPIARRVYAQKVAGQINHGKPAGYKAHRRLGVPQSACAGACQRAWNEATNEYRRASRGARS